TTVSTYGPQPVLGLLRAQQDRFPRGVAWEIGLHPVHVRAGIDGVVLPDIETFLRLPEVLGLTVEDCWTPEVVRDVLDRARR
ncbi:hypothetical protein, partial [Pseudactinotalea sp.]|uniref:hypothetical protein n=1 Tax=Pseudactinotalea sp. TaxID=1926260 RepID=UPI003B3A1749